ncbi:excinuclease ABC subunit UvrC [Streptomyces griseofuscus]|uniref:UvrABC system protein C n=1 Tax=Streptomyces griseofuscus TaxID=146922 RepID=A0A7H1Q706_9ACTN|nr:MULTISPECIES: excinuclease ABC subunit UvrC [Streptomyces]MBA9045189.1 excinuclease ABC subunit C [Streptomyces murinus]QNT96086.1 excinuclease ABC subunit UvrC [Streptomyces griseofuscus]BBC96705.1 excinuclease ABC subunit UvrC [Streptomyces rochei]
MADPSSYRPRPGEIPDTPGVYRFRDEHRRVIYVGKAKSLRQRLANYFQDLANLHPRTRTMVTTAASVEWTVVSTEVEALQLEYSWIKEYDPRFNVKYRDDKSYPYLAVTMNEEFPRVQVMRGHKKKGVRYFGPYGHAWAIRDTVDLLLRVFPVRTCSAGVFKNAARTGRPCLLGYIGKCSAPCVGRISPEDHRDLADEFCDFMAGRTGTYLRRLEKQMMEAAEDMEYERAARLRDDIGALKKAMEKSAVVLADATDADLIAVAEDELEAAVQIFHVRGGRVRGQRGWVTDKVEEITTSALVEHALQQLYGEETGDAVPKEVLVPALPEPVEPVQEWLTGRRGSNVSLRIPQRGDKKALMETVQRNAQQALALHKTKRASDLTTRSRALEEIADALDLDSAPLRIECYDISHLQGDDVVASMVVFEDGLQRKGEYRRFQIKGFAGQDDVRSMHEVITRRFKRYLAEKERTGEWADGEEPGTDGEAVRTDDGAVPAETGVTLTDEGTAPANTGIPLTDERPAPTDAEAMPVDAGTAPEDTPTTPLGTAPPLTPVGTDPGAPADTDPGAPAGTASLAPATPETAPRPAPLTTRPGPTTPDPLDDPLATPLNGSLKDDDGRPRKFAYPPQLVVVDGGQPQVAAARRALDELGIDDIAVCGLAKRLEEVWLPGEDDPVVLPRTSEGLYLLQRIRDEAHRFAITYQRTKRAKRFRAGPLDDVPGLGETRKQALIKHFGSVKRLRSATIEQIQEVPGIGRKTAETIAAALAQAAPAAPAVNTATGEIMEDEEPETTAGSSGEPVTAGPPDERRGQET